MDTIVKLSKILFQKYYSKNILEIIRLEIIPKILFQKYNYINSHNEYKLIINKLRYFKTPKINFQFLAYYYYSLIYYQHCA